MNKLYKYTGTVSSFSYDPKGCGSADIILFDLNDFDKAPMRITALSELAKYIRDIECTDAEERYLSTDWYFDRNLYLHRIEIPSNHPSIPAKIITQDDLLRGGLEIFGQRDYIDECDPFEMSNEEYFRWNRWKYEHN